MGSQIESLWVFAILAKLKSFTPLNITCLLVTIALVWLTLSLIFWSCPGGPAWGKYYFCQFGLNSAPKRLPFGPRGYPIFGSMSLMSKTENNLPHRNIATLASTSSSPQSKRLMAFSLGFTRVVVTCDPEVAKEILNSPVFVDRPVEESAYGLMFNRSIGFAPYGFYWRMLRRISAVHLFSPSQIKATETQRFDTACQMVSALENQCYARGRTVRDVLKRSSLHYMMGSVFGSEIFATKNTETLDEFISLVDRGYELLGTLNWGDHLSWLIQFDIQNVRSRCTEIVPRVNMLVSRIIGDRRARRLESANHAFVDVLLSLEGSDKLCDSDMIAILWEMIFRGTDTVAILMEWILARIVLHPDVQSKVHNELDSVVGRSKPVRESDLSSLVYLTAVIKEVLRLHPPGPLLAWARMGITDTIVAGYHVPRGTTAMVNIWAIARDPQVWEDPLEFKPERFMTKEGEAEFSVLGSDLRLAPFGSGRRGCPGKTLGLTTASFWIASLLHEFEWLRPSNEGPVDLTETMKLSCEMKNPLNASLRPRRKSVTK